MVDLQLYYKPKYMQNNNTYTIFDFDKNLSNMPMDAEAINKFIATSDHFKEIFGIGNFYNTIGIDDINLLYKFYIALLNTEATSQYKIHNNISSSDLNNFICHSSNGYEVIMASEYSVEIQDCCYKPKLSMKTDSNTSMLLTPKGDNWVDIIHYYTNLPREEAICFLAQLLHINWNNLTCYSNDPYYRGCDHHRSYSPESFRDPIWDKAIDDITLTDHFDIIGTNGLIVSRILQYKWGEQEFCIVEPIRKGATTLGQFRPQAHFYNEDKFEKFSRAKVIFAQDMRVARILQKKLEQQSSDPRKFIVTAILGYDLSPFKWNFLRGHDVIFVPAPTPESLSFVKSVYKKCVDHRASSFKISKKFLLRGKSPDIGDSPNFVNRLEQYIAENSLFIEEETFIEATLDELTNTSLKYNKFKKIFYNIGLFCQSDEDSQMLSNSTMKVIPLDPRLTPKNAYKLSDVTGNHIYKPENLVMVSGLKESGKIQITYLLARSALQIEDKIIPFNKFSTASLGNICIVDYETLPNELDGNLHQHELNKFRDSKLFVLSRLADKLPQSLESFDLTDETFRNALTEYITDHDCKLLILDNLTGLMGEKIDQGTAANTVLRWMDSLQQRNICVIFVMHQSIDAAKNDRDRNRGSRLFKDRARVIINLHGVKEINAAKEDDKFYPEEVRELAKSPGLTFGIQFTAFKTAPVFTEPPSTSPSGEIMSDSISKTDITSIELPSDDKTINNVPMITATMVGGRVPLNKIEPDANQTRKEFSEAGINALAESISKDGLITPILVAATDASEGKYKIVDGGRRYKALLKLAEAHPDKEEFQLIPVTITKGDVTIEGLLANMARLQYNPMEFAEALEQIKNRDNLNDGQLGDLIGKSRSGVTEYLSLLKLPDEIKNAAKKESCVPFRVLKKLVAKDIPTKEKIDEYKKLHKFHQAKRQNEENIEKRTNSKKIWTADRRAKGLQKKVDALAEKFDGFNVNEIKDSQQKVELKKSLEAIMRKATEMVKLLGE